MKLSEESIEKCCDLAKCAYRYLSGVNEEWKRASIAWKLWPTDYVKEDRALPWLCIILPAFLEYYLEQRGVESEERQMAVAFFAFAMSHGLSSDDNGRRAWAERSAKFADYFKNASKSGESALGVISIAAFLEKKRAASAEKLFACALLYAYMLGAYWVMRSIDESRAVNSAKQIALFVKCDKLTEDCKYKFDAFADNIDLVDDDDGDEIPDETDTSSDESDSKAPEGFFEDDDKFDDDDPDDDEDIVATRAKYSGDFFENDEKIKKLDFMSVDLGLKTTNDFWRYIMRFRLDEEDDGLEMLEADWHSTCIAAVIFVALTFINGFFFKGEMKDALAVLKRSFAYRFSSQDPALFYVYEIGFAATFAAMLKDGDAKIGVPAFIKYVEARIDASKSNSEEQLMCMVSEVYKYAFTLASIFLPGILDKGAVRPRTPREMFEELFDFISVSELARITVEMYKANCVNT